MTARVGAVLHVGELLVGAPLAVLSAVPPVHRGLLYACIAGFAAWVAVYAYVSWFRGLIVAVVVGDIVVTVLLCLLHSLIAPAHRVDEGSSWIATIASMCVISVAMAWPAAASVPAGLVVVAAFQLGFVLAGWPDKGHNHTAILLIQVVSAAVVMALLRRADAVEAAAVAAERDSRREAALRAAGRADESAQLRLLHDTALTTLTLVGTGAVPGGERSVRERAAADLMVIEHLATVDEHSEERWVRLDERLERLADDAPFSLRVHHELMPCHAPKSVAQALVSSAAEALRNTARHAGVPDARLTLRTDGGRVRVDIIDTGVGFDPATAPVHRFGIRQSIVGRMVSAGGSAEVTSSPGAGTRWCLHWPAERVA
jgi:signal transduction histidine kinase